MRFAIRLLALAPPLLLVLAPSRAPAAPKLPHGISPLKARQVYMLAQEPLRERAEHLGFRERESVLRRLARRRGRGGTEATARGERARPETGDDMRAGGGEAPRPAFALARPRDGGRLLTALAPNVRCNDPSDDLITRGYEVVVEGQCETAIARWNDKLVAAWNDGKGFDDGTRQTTGWATSVDGGATWVDQGVPPLPQDRPTWIWMSDPVLAVNPTTGAFYFAALGAVPGLFSSIGVIKGRFTGDSFAWEAPSLVRKAPLGSHLLDKEWIAVDPADGRVFVSYTDFPDSGSEIDFQWADSSLALWSPYRRISSPIEQGRVQGSRPAVGPAGDVYVVYYLIGLTDVDYFRIARSLDRGGSFSAPRDAAAFYPNFGTGAPGFSRPYGLHFPSIAVDRSGGAHHGRIHLAWNGALNWFDDVDGLGSGAVRAEIEPNDVAALATPVAVGDEVHGMFWEVNERDYYALSLGAGESIIAAVDSLENGEGVTLRLFAPDGVTSLTYLQVFHAELDPGVAPPTWTFTAPRTATYYLRVACIRSFGRYRVKTGPAARTVAERPADQRDVFSAWSDDGGLTWSEPARVNRESAGYDDWLPEIAVGPDGQVACAWFDWRDAAPGAAGGESSVYLATSADGGATWQERGPVTDTLTAWSFVATNITPNQGDYIALVADGRGYAVCWSDGRGGNPDTYMAAVPVATASVAGGEGPAALRLSASSAIASAPVRLAFELPAAERARLVILDVSGRRVRALLDEPFGAGAHAADWDLADAAGRPAAAGLYWALLESAGRRAVARVVVLR